MNESMFLKFFGNVIKRTLIDFLIENSIAEYSLKELATATNNFVTLIEIEILELKEMDLILIASSDKIRLNLESEIIKKLIEIDNLLTRQTADKLENK